MGNVDWAQESLPGWNDWLFSLHGGIFLVSLAIIVVVSVGLYRNWQRDHKGDLTLPTSKQNPPRR